MTVIAYNLFISPFAGLGKRIMTGFEIIGYARAAAHLADRGFYDEANECMRRVHELKK
jgi:hypothetical protein